MSLRYLGFVAVIAGWAIIPVQADSSSILVYPDSASSSNPRLPCIPPASVGGELAMAVEAPFVYDLAPLVRFEDGGNLEVRLRSASRARASDVIILESGTSQLIIRAEGQAKGEVLTLVYREGRKDLVGASTSISAQDWQSVRLDWDAKNATLTQGEEKITIALPAAIEPSRVKIEGSEMASLRVTGAGELRLDWQQGYAAVVQPYSGSKDILLRLFGFDTYFVSAESARREFPMLQAINASDADSVVQVAFSMTAENGGNRSEWTQQFEVPARTAAMVPVKFPQPLTTDIYHLKMNSAQPEVSQIRNFLYVQERSEGLSSPKFGLHDSNSRTFGFWPDVLPISISHSYARWGYIQGPAWQKDSGIGIETPAEQWNWNERIDWSIAQGLIPYVCLQSVPYADWMREREYPSGRMKKYPWGYMGGYPRLDLYRRFVKEIVSRYKGKVSLYEVENEPNSHLGGVPPEDYVTILRSVWEEGKAADPAIKIFGICGTGDFVPWMKDVFRLGGASFMDGVSIHTYSTPRLPEEADLPGKLAELDNLIASAGKPMDLANSETGTYVALREEAEHPIAVGRLQELIRQGVPNLAVPKGWPNHAQDEWEGSLSIVRNTVYNFLAGAQFFTFFGWNSQWPDADWWSRPSAASGSACFAMIAASKSGERTPSLYTLAIGVLVEQMKGTLVGKAVKVEQSGVAGGVFPKEGGGELAILWSPLGKRSVLIEAPNSDVTVLSLYGRTVNTSLSPGKNVFRLELGEQPIYVHSKLAGLRLLPSPVVNIVPKRSRGQTSGFSFTMINRSDTAWNGTIKYPSDNGWKFSPTKQSFDIAPGGRSDFEVSCSAPTGTKKGSYSLDATTELPDGTRFTFPLTTEVRPTLSIMAVGPNFNWRNLADWQRTSAPLRLEQPEQVVVGRPPALSSLQEERFWKGSTELSGEVWIAHDADALLICAKVKDQNFSPPATWPDVRGSSVELFLDTRSGQSGLGEARYSKGVRQLVVKPMAKPGDLLEIWQPSEKSGELSDIESTGGAWTKSGDYWLALRIPWASLGISRASGSTIGFDAGINGPSGDGKKRKTQMMLFGTATNSGDASAFGMATIDEKPKR